MHAAIDQDAPAAFGFPDYVAAMAGLAPRDARPLSLRLCLPARVMDAGDAYLAYLMREAAMHAVLYTSLSTVRQLVFDGWGAAHLAQRQLVGLLAHLREHFRFMPGELGDYEAAVTVQAGTAAYLGWLRRQGFNRIRIEVGTGDAATLGRVVDEARAAGFRSVGLGLAYGMPGRDFRGLRRLLDAVAEAAPDRVLLGHQPGPDADPPPGGVAQRMRQLCGDRLDMAGYTARGAVFARLPGATDGQPAVPAYYPGTHLVGCGLGASGRVAQLSWRNVADLQDYYARLDRNEIPLADGPVPDLIEHTQPYLMQVKEF